MKRTKLSFRVNENTVVDLQSEAEGVGPVFRGVLSDPFDDLAPAATGGLGAQRRIAKRAIGMLTDSSRDTEMLLTEGLVFARLAAAHGDRSDQVRVIVMLGLLTDLVGEDAAAEQVGEMLARIKEHRLDLDVDILPDLVRLASPRAVALASRYQQRIKDHMPCCERIPQPAKSDEAYPGPSAKAAYDASCIS